MNIIRKIKAWYHYNRFEKYSECCIFPHEKEEKRMYHYKKWKEYL